MPDGSAPASTGKIEINPQVVLLGLEACISDDYGSVTLGLMQRLREVLFAQEPRDPKPADHCACPATQPTAVGTHSCSEQPAGQKREIASVQLRQCN